MRRDILDYCVLILTLLSVFQCLEIMYLAFSGLSDLCELRIYRVGSSSML